MEKLMKTYGALMMQITLGDKNSQIFGVGMKLGIFKALTEKPQHSKEIAKSLNLPYRSVDRILLFCSVYKVCKFFVDEKKVTHDDLFIRGEKWEDLMKLEELAVDFAGECYEELVNFREVITKKRFSSKKFERFFYENTTLFKVEDAKEYPNVINVKSFVCSGFLCGLINSLVSEFDFFEIISSKKGMSLKDILELTKMDEKMLLTSLKYLTSIHALQLNDGKYFTGTFHKLLSPMGYFKKSMSDILELYTRFWRKFEHSVRTGKAASEKEFGKPYFEYLKSSEKYQSAYHNAVKKHLKLPTLFDIDCKSDKKLKEIGIDFTKFKSVCDVGGSTGTASNVLLKHDKYNNIQKVFVFDLPDVIKNCKSNDSRLKYIGGSFFKVDTIPKNCDAYLLRAVLHDWSLKKQLEITTNIFNVMKKGSLLFVMETLFLRTWKLAGGDLHTLACYGEAYLPSLKEMIDTGKKSGLKFKGEDYISTEKQRGINVVIFEKL